VTAANANDRSSIRKQARLSSLNNELSQATSRNHECRTLVGPFNLGESRASARARMKAFGFAQKESRFCPLSCETLFRFPYSCCSRNRKRETLDADVMSRSDENKTQACPDVARNVARDDVEIVSRLVSLRSRVLFILSPACGMFRHNWKNFVILRSRRAVWRVRASESNNELSKAIG